MKPYIDIQGSGEGVTILWGEVASAGNCETPVVYGAANAQLRFLTIQQAGTFDMNTCTTGLIYRDIHPHPEAVDNAKANLLHVTVAASHAGSLYGIYSQNSELVFEHVTLHVAAGAIAYAGLYSENSFIAVRNSEITVTGIQGTTGIYITSPLGGTLWMDDSRVKVITGNGSHTVALLDVISFAEVTGSTLSIEDDCSTPPCTNHLVETAGGTTRIGSSLLTSNVQLEQVVTGGNNWIAASRMTPGATPASATCAGVYDEANWTFYANTCP